MIGRRHLRILIAFAAAALMPGVAAAHPHVFVEAKSEIVFDGEGRMESVRQVWRFDAAFSAFATQGLDADGDGVFSPEELQPLAKINVESLKEFDFFTFLTVGEDELDFVDPQEYWLDYSDGQLTLFYNLPLKTPIKVGPETTLEVFDPDYFVAFDFVQDGPVTVSNAPTGCDAVYHPPRGLDAQTMALLGAIPAEQKQLPEDLAGVTADLANVATITCP